MDAGMSLAYRRALLRLHALMAVTMSAYDGAEVWRLEAGMRIGNWVEAGYNFRSAGSRVRRGYAGAQDERHRILRMTRSKCPRRNRRVHSALIYG